jgi:hypothetical protein
VWQGGVAAAQLIPAPWSWTNVLHSS